MGWKSNKILILILGITACVKDKPNTTVPDGTGNGSVYIVCEGNFGNGDGSLCVYDPETDSVTEKIYTNANGAALGDVFQSMTRIGDSLFLCVNNSDKVVVINASDKKASGIISIPKPRYILPINNTTAYVSTLYSNKVYEINPQTLSITGITSVPHNNPEGMCRIMDQVYVCPWDTNCNYIYAKGATSGSIFKPISIPGYAPHAVLRDKEGMLWVLSGNVPKNRGSVLCRIDPSSNSILKTYQFASGTDAIKPAFNATMDTLYFIEVKYDGSADNNGIYRMSIHSEELPTTAFVACVPFQYFWALGIEPQSGNIYVGDPVGFTQKGAVSVYKADGTLLKTFKTGVGPGQFYFDN